MPRISFAWAVITQSHQIKNVCGEFPKAVSSPCLVTSFSLNLDSNKRVHSRRWGNHLIDANFHVLFVLSSGISQSAWHGQWVAETMLPALRDSSWEGELSICLHFSPLATVLFPYLNPFQCLTCPILFICFSSSCRSTCSTFPIRYSSLQFSCAHHDGNSHTPQPASAFVALWRGIG